MKRRTQSVLALFAIGSILFASPLFSVESDRSVFPNPFSEGKTVKFQLTVPQSALIRIDVYNIRGQHVRNLVGGASGEQYQPGEYEIPWDGTDESGNSVIQGVYICVLISEDFIMKVVKVIKIESS